MTAQSVGPRRTIMKTFTIDEQNNITAFGTQEEAAATTPNFKEYVIDKWRAFGYKVTDL
jgi:hypothetical protein